MSEQERHRLLARLDSTRRETLSAFEGVDMSRVIYPESGWRIQDAIGHIAVWEVEAARSLRAFAGGDEYRIDAEVLGPEEAGYNRAAVEARRSLTAAEIMAEFVSAREEMKAALNAIPLDKLTQGVLCPWGEHRSVPSLIEGMIEHEVEHRAQIIEVARG